ncbi:ParB N-terminal domain-containing protein [Pseudomonas mediterranea]|uniref:ParB N-terminal domain-containing protein n=1 Tax=Pseudomonas mediterranea TaxID=183795 RepID=UPI0006D8CD00|nr:ParB N-terminal domain-containing protein [Pseudomonas mediterranea]
MATSEEATAAPGVVDVGVARIVRSPELQPRKGLDLPTVKRYAAQLDAGHQFPPLTIYQVGTVLYLADGWHRLAAAESLDHGYVKAQVIVGTFEEAQWAAGEANLRHGLPLKSSEIRNAFRLFIKARKYRQRGGFMSYAEIGAVFGKGKTTIRSWMLKDFPKIAARMSSDDHGKNNKWCQEDTETDTERLLREGQELIQQLQQRIAGLSGSDRQALISAMQEGAQAMAVEVPFEAPRLEPADF